MHYVYLLTCVHLLVFDSLTSIHISERRINKMFTSVHYICLITCKIKKFQRKVIGDDYSLLINSLLIKQVIFTYLIDIIIILPFYLSFYVQALVAEWVHISRRTSQYIEQM
ncbi:Hypothetical_protein [Hexamita inflata]|uniref:Hypothetical_protein n=1 Tax=Hexamita inflata TaxID=28002 RepID=A0AA86Q704_9EUKA|nr:Hypothetical protein HINF_LOCUS34897 [Hexamita inflata]